MSSSNSDRVGIVLEGVVYGVILAFVLLFLVRLVAVCYVKRRLGRLLNHGEHVHAERVTLAPDDSFDPPPMLNSDDLELQIEEQKRDIAEKRLERRECYHQYLKPFTMIVKADDLVDSTPQQQVGTSDPSETCSHPQHFIITGRVSQHVLRIPTFATISTTRTTLAQRSVEPSCAMCLADYEVGDTIVWASEPGCSHVFHRECILQWVSIGKKRCPVCRNWFVPKKLLQDLKKEMNLTKTNDNATSNITEQPNTHEDEGSQTSGTDTSSDPSDDDGMV